MKAEDGKMRLTDVADTEQLFRIIQSIHSLKAEPFKQWMAQVTAQRIDQMQELEAQVGQSVISSEKASDYLPPTDRWQELPEEDNDE